MGSISRIEDFEVWRKSRELVNFVFKITSDDKFNKEFFLKDQLKRSAISIMSNIAEGYGRGGNKEFIQFLYNANGSLNELKSQIYISRDAGLIEETDLNISFDLLKQIELMIKALAKKLRESEYKGSKYKVTEP
jgi:four helix bundle protein